MIAITFLIEFGVINNCKEVLQILIAVLNGISCVYICYYYYSLTGMESTDDHDRHHDPVALKMKALYVIIKIMQFLLFNQSIDVS